MARSRASAKKAGSQHERSTADYLAATVDDRIDRRVKTGAADKGDIGGVRTTDGRRVAVECKDYGGQIKAATWMGEARVEAENDGAVAAVVIAKRLGTTDPAKQWVLMELQDLVVLLGGRPSLGRPEPTEIFRGGVEL